MTNHDSIDESNAIRAALDDLVERSLQTASHVSSCSWGPIDLELMAEDRSTGDDIVRALAPGRGLWRNQRVVTVSSATIPIDMFPEELRPVGTTSAILRDTDLVALASGHEHCVWILRSDIDLALRWVTNDNDVPLWEQLSPLRAAARWVAAHHGGATVHCGAVGNHNGAVLLVGDSGAGKSTTTMACLGTELEVLGDDFCFIDASGPTPIVDAMYRLAKLDDRSLELLPALRERVVGRGLRGKSLIELDDLTVTHRPIVAVCHVVRDHSRPTGVEPLHRMAALRAAAPSTLFQVRLAEQETWDALAATVRHAQTWTLHVDDVTDAPHAITELLESIGPAGSSNQTRQ
ncbi:MAG: hypothetical protein AB8G14_13785 [Ilumatobacter sp.]